MKTCDYKAFGSKDILRSRHPDQGLDCASLLIWLISFF